MHNGRNFFLTIQLKGYNNFTIEYVFLIFIINFNFFTMNWFDIFMTLLLICSILSGLVSLLLTGIHHYRFHYACQYCYKEYNTAGDWVENKLMHLLQLVLILSLCFDAFYFWMFGYWKLSTSLVFCLGSVLLAAPLWELFVGVLVRIIGSQHEYRKDKNKCF